MFEKHDYNQDFCFNVSFASTISGTSLQV